MQSRNQVIDDVARLVTNALGLAQNASGEIENAVMSLLDRYLAERGLVTREEFEASQLSLEKALTEINELRKSLEEFQKDPKTNARSKKIKKPSSGEESF